VNDLDQAIGLLAAELGVATEYWDWHGRRVQVPTSTVQAVLAALAVPAHSTAQAAASLHEHLLGRWRRMLPPTVVVRQASAATFWVHAAPGDHLSVWVELEDGGRRPCAPQSPDRVEAVAVDGELVAETTYAVPGDLPLGWHRIQARSAPGAGGPLDLSGDDLGHQLAAAPDAGPHSQPVAGDGSRAGAATLVVTPDRLELGALAGQARAWGFMTQLYQVRSRGSWGVGDLADLADLASWSGRELGAGFVLVNPLHAASPRAPMEPSPYLPTTRRFPSPLYLRIQDVPEMAALTDSGRAQVESLHTRLCEVVDGLDTIDRDASWAAKRAALELLAQVPLSGERASALAAFAASQGPALEDFATWCALVERHGPRWRSWPVGLQRPHAAQVALERDSLAAEVRLHVRAQWWLDEQLRGAQQAALAAGMAIGIVHDLAVGVDPDGFDSWALGDVLAAGVAVGAPPDDYNQQGQCWTQPPWRPQALAECGYAPYRDMLGAVLRHAGGIRVDHVLGLFRLWLVPDGASPDQGTYVRQDHEALVGILALEAARAGAVVIGEDLGTVEPWVREFLQDRGIAATSVLWFERGGAGEPLPAEQWRSLCLASVTTHDLPPTAGYLRGEHVRIREELGLLTRPAADERAGSEAERARWLDHLRGLGLLGGLGTADGAAADDPEVVEALHRFLVTTPARLLGICLPDAVGDIRAQNQPGTTDEYPNWRVPLSDAGGTGVWMDDLRRSSRLHSLVAVMADIDGGADRQADVPAGTPVL